MKIECISTGGITNTIADPKIIFKKALTLNATANLCCAYTCSRSCTIQT